MKTTMMWRVTNVRGDVIYTRNKCHPWMSLANTKIERVMVVR